jgi:hypothetical protein
MSCALCSSANQAEFPAGINIHFPGRKNLDVLVFAKVLVCLDCGFSRFTTPETELALLAGSTLTSKAFRNSPMC